MYMFVHLVLFLPTTESNCLSFIYLAIKLILILISCAYLAGQLLTSDKNNLGEVKIREKLEELCVSCECGQAQVEFVQLPLPVSVWVTADNL